MEYIFDLNCTKVTLLIRYFYDKMYFDTEFANEETPQLDFEVIESIIEPIADDDECLEIHKKEAVELLDIDAYLSKNNHDEKIIKMYKKTKH